MNVRRWNVALGAALVAFAGCGRPSPGKVPDVSGSQASETPTQVIVEYTDKASATRRTSIGEETRRTTDAPHGHAHVRLLAFNDFHGHLRPPTGGVPGVNGPVGGAAYLAAHLKRLGASEPSSLVVAAGDLVGASPLSSSLFHDEPAVEALNAMHLSVTSLGNHELDEGWGELWRLRRGGCHPKDGCTYAPTFRGASYEILAANVTTNNPDFKMLAPYTIREVSGVRIAFVGMPLRDAPESLAPENVAGLAFADEVATANALVPQIQAQGVEAIVLLIHQGGETASTSLNGCDHLRGPVVPIVEKLHPAFDAVISGHTHALYNCVVAGRTVTSALSFGRVVTTLDLEVDTATRDVVSAKATNHAVTHDVEPDPEVQAIVDRAVAVAAPIENKVIGRITETMHAGGRGGQGSPLGAVVADAQLFATRKLGARLALVNVGGVRSDLVFARSGVEHEDGLVTYGEAFAAQPFGNSLVVLTVTGRELKTVLERAAHAGMPLEVSDGVAIRYEPSKARAQPSGHGETKAALRVRDIVFRGARSGVADTDKVQVTVSSYLASSDPTLRQASQRIAGPGDLEALQMYFTARSPLSLPKTPRNVRVTGAPVEDSQAHR